MHHPPAKLTPDTSAISARGSWKVAYDGDCEERVRSGRETARVGGHFTWNGLKRVTVKQKLRT